MIHTSINAGICGFQTTVAARSDDMQMVKLEIASGCEKNRRLAEALSVPIDAYQEIGEGSEGVVPTAGRTHLTGCCAGCVIPCGIFKSVQVAGGVSLSALASLTMERVED